MPQRDVQIKLGFTADVREAKRQLEDLNSSIQKITFDHMNTHKLTESTQESIDAVLQLNTILQNSKNNLGTLDLSKFITSLRNSGMTISDYGKHFTELGDKGVIAFARINQAIQQANTPLIQAKGIVSDFIDQMERTIKLQASYGVLNSFTGVFKSALSYAQDLNKNLTDIRIVTMKSSDEMAKFAKNANQASKALSASTDDFTKASLIYYQQGLNDQEVMERTNTTIKLANTSGESAEQISSYMTAIWNNFDDGTKSLEYYADALSYLGAVSAASNADIAEGLQSFAATASTVGLSYEYATAALTTLVDKTQQSASTIGNALKTIFARLNSVKLGETLEDGVDLTKYSSALATVGVNVLTANGNLKTMDTILDELAERWKTLGEAEKTALAQTVGGVRQYNNLISLMENYDTMKLWASGAAGSTGYLNQQAEIYAESWEGAKKRVESALQGLYDTLVDDKFFIWLNNTFATLISSINNVIDTMGGIPTVLIGIGTIFTTLAQDKIIGGLEKIEQFFMPMTERGRAQLEKIKKEFNEETTKSLTNLVFSPEGASNAVEGLLFGQGENTSVLDHYNEVYANLSDRQRQIVEGQIESSIQIAQQIVDLSTQLDIAKQRQQQLEKEKKDTTAIVNLQNELNNQIRQANLKLEARNKQLDKTIDKMATTGPSGKEAVLGIASALGQTALAAHSVIGLVKTISNPNISGWEKIVSTIFLLGTAITQITHLLDASNIKQLLINANALVELATEKLITKELKKQNKEKEKSSDKDKKKSVWDIYKIIKKGRNPDSFNVENYTDKKYIQAMGEAQNYQDALETPIGKLIDSLFGLNEVLEGATGIGIAGFAALGVGIAATTVLVYNFYKALKNDGAHATLVRLQKDSEDLQNRIKDLNSEYDNLKSTIDSLKSAKDTFADLTEGTAEWTKAVFDNNKQIIELLKNYDLLGKTDLYSTDGKIYSITDEGYEEILNRQNDKIRLANEDYYLNQSEIAQRNLEVFTGIGKDSAATQYKGKLLGAYNSVDTRQFISKVLQDVAAGSLSWNSDFSGLVSNGNSQISEANLNLINSNEDLIAALKGYTDTLLGYKKDEAVTGIELMKMLLGDGYTNENYESAYNAGAKDVFESKRSEANDMFTWYGKENAKKILEKEYGELSDFKLVNNKDVWGSSDDTFTFNVNGQAVTIGRDKMQAILARRDLEENSDKYKSYLTDKSPEANVNWNSRELQHSEQTQKSWKEDDKANVENVAKALKELNPELKENDELTNRLAIDIQRFSLGWQDLNKNIDNYAKILKTKGAQGTAEYEKALVGIKQNLEDMMGLDNVDWINRDFIIENLEDIEKAAQGSEEAYNRVQQNLFIETANIAESGKTAAIQAIQEIQNANFIAGQVVTEDYYENLIKLVDAANITANDLVELFDSLNLEVEVDVSAFDSESGKLIDSTKLFESIKQVRSKGDTGSLLKAANSSSSSKEKKELERYYHIKKVLEDLKDTLDDLSTAEDRAFGKDRIAAMADQVAYYEKLYEAQQKYYDAVTSNLAAEESQLASMGLSFDAQGIPTNAEQWYYDNSLDDNAMKLWEKWEEDYGLKMDLENQMRDALNNIYDKKLNIITYRAKFQIEMDEFSLKVLEYLKEQLDDPAYETAEGIKNLSLQMERYNHEYEVYKKELLDILDFASGGNGLEYLTRLMNGEDIESIADSLDLTDEARKELFDAAEKMMSSASSMKQVWEGMLASIDEFFESWQQKFENLIADVQHLVNVSSKLKDIVNLIGKDRLGVDNATMRRFDETASAAAISTYNIRAMAERAAQEAYDAAVANGWDQDPNMSEQWEGIRKRLQEAKENTVQATYDMAQAFQSQFENAMNIVIEEWEDAISGIYKNLDSLQEAFDRANKLDDNYLDTYDQAYRIEKLLRKIDKSVNDSDILKNRQALANLYDEINGKQEAGIELSQYQVDAYQKEYELLLALQALQDAQNAKSTVRMRRDSEGNMGYVYTADQTNIDKAQNDYNDAAYAYAQLNEGRVDDLQAAYLSLWNEYSNAVQKASAEHRELTDEEMSYFTEQFGYITSQMEEAFNYNTRLLGLTSLDYWDLTKNFDQTILSHVTGYQTLNDLAASYEQAVTNSIIAIRNAVVTYNNQIEDNVNINTESINRYLDSTQRELEKTDEKVVELGDEYEHELSKMVDETEGFRTVWERTMESVIQEAGDVGSALSILGQEYSAQTVAAKGLADANYTLADSYRELNAAIKDTEYQKNKASGDGTHQHVWQHVHTQHFGINNDGTEEFYQCSICGETYSKITNKPTGSSGTSTSSSSTSIVDPSKLIGSTGQAYNNGEYNNKISAGTVNIYQGPSTAGYAKNNGGEAKFEFFDNGGYTGEWGTNGRLAVLHQKELVLNANDTENFLGAMGIVRDVADLLKLDNYGANANLSSSTIGQLGNMQQNITINADFPNATDRNEIGLAFNDLLNRASQLMNQK